MDVEMKHCKPLKKPRYLVGQATRETIISDLQMYNKHRYNLCTTTHKVDDKPPSMNPNQYVNSQRLIQDSIRVQQINAENREMIKKINKINNLGGKVDSFNPNAYTRQTNWRSRELKMMSIIEHNKLFYKRILAMKSDYEVEEYNKDWKKKLEIFKNGSKYPFELILNKVPLDVRLKRQPSISNGEFVERPKCFMDFRIKNGVYLGRIIIELYHDYVPVTVQNFISICTKKDGLSYKNCNVHRIALDRYIETGDITKGSGKGGTSIYGDMFDEEKHVLKHTKMGVLSTVPVAPHRNNSQFSISLTELKEFDTVRVVFGKVVIGNTTLCKLNDMGKKFGSPIAPVIINDCGIYIKGKTPAFIGNYKLS